MGLFSSDREVDVKTAFAHKLAPVPSSMFIEKGVRVCIKSALKKPSHISQNPDAQFFFSVKFLIFAFKWLGLGLELGLGLGLEFRIIPKNAL